MKHYIRTIILAGLFAINAGVAKLQAQEQITIGSEIWIEPGQRKEEIEEWFRLSSQNKMRSVRLFMMWNYIEEKPGVFNFIQYDWAFAAANKYNIKIEATLCAIHGPVSASKIYHGRPQFNELFPTEELMHKSAIYIEKTVNKYKNNKALESWWLLNEPRRFDATSPLATQKLQEWVKQKYKTIEAVNKAWIENYKNFTEIKYDPLWTQGNYFYWPVPSIDWYQFQRDYLTFNLQWIAGQIRQYDKKTEITMNPANVFESAHQYDLPAYKTFNNILGASMHASWQLRFMEREQYGYAVAGISEILKGAAPQGKFWISELQGGNNIWSGKTPMCPDSLDLAQWIWTGIGSGARKVVYWALNYRRQGIEAGEWGLFGFRGEATDRSRVTLKMNQVLEKYQAFFKDAKPYKPKVTLILSPETMRVLLHIDAFGTGARLFDKDAHMRSLMMWFVALQEIGCQADIRYMNDYEWNSPEQGRIAILANAVSIPTAQVTQIQQFVASGNQLIAEGLTGFFDEYETNTFQTSFDMEKLLGGRMTDIRYQEDPKSFQVDGQEEKLPAYIWKPLLQATSGTAKIAGKDGGDIIALRNSFGNGTTLWMPACFSLGALPSNTRPLALLAGTELKTTLQSQPFYFKEYTKGALLRMMQNGNQYLTVITNNNKTAINAELVNTLKLNPTVIFGNGAALEGTKVHLTGRETLVILWK
ncbi:hypothetical protein FW774_19425 [Pedobacter sp. BS3]|uniref:beta-galactosidase n=1 Tax=Pedobacter sp. BS3 TaxID=2567937 RepID=UPI0011EF0777|nr:beta-galactosidase [Pedobacter sp. BS3]TZF81107.1 hypothetical protein FW774_19425 [Pedobacter sp. BS3]